MNSPKSILKERTETSDEQINTGRRRDVKE